MFDTEKTEEEKTSNKKTNNIEEESKESEELEESEETTEVDVSALRDIRPNHKITLKRLDRIEANQKAIYQEIKEMSRIQKQPKYKFVDKQIVNETKSKTFDERLADLFANKI